MKLALSNPTATQRRRTLIDIALRRQRPGAGSSAIPSPEAQLRWPDLRETLEGIPWAVTGAVAARLYMPERATRDLDILVRGRDAAAVEQRLAQAGFSKVGRLAIGGSSWLHPDGTPIDVIEGEDAWAGPAIAEADGNRDTQGFPTLARPYQVLMKLAASRVQDLADVSRMLGSAPEAELQAARRVIREHAADLADDLESLIHLGKLELGEPT